MVEPSDFNSIILKAASGDPWYGSSTLALLSDVSAAEASAHPIAGGHSIWEIVLHMLAWLREVERRLGGGEAAHPEEGDWPKVSDAGEAAWQEIKAEFMEANEHLCSRVISFERPSWSDVIGGERNPALGTGVTYAEMVIGLAQHNAYHSGQIALLKKLLH